MALKIGSNLSYFGKNFLDQRQGEAITKSNLLSWSIPVPEGFEVYCEGKWYVYLSDFTSSETGHFKLRIDNEVEDSQIQSEVTTNTNDIQHLRDTVYPLEFKNVSGGGMYKVGSQIIPEVSWELWKDEEKIIPDSIEVIINGIDDSRGVLSGKERYVGSRLLPNEATLIYITATYKGISKTIESPILYNLVPKKYLILSETSDPIQEITDDMIALEDWAGARKPENLGESSFNSKYSLNCSGHETTGGVYIHYLMPECYCPLEDSMQILVGGLEMSDYSISLVSDFAPTYPEGFRNYTDICFNHKQNGLLNIEFKEVVYQTY